MSDQTTARRIPIIAMGFAVAALVIVSIAVVVVLKRGSAGEAATADKPPVVADPQPSEVHVPAAEVVRLERLDEVEPRGGGLRVRDAELAKKLGLGPDDVIVSLSGRAVKREFDVHEVLFNLSMASATTLYAELADARLVRWRLDGDLRTARYATPFTPATPTSPSLFGTPDPNDPLLDTIVRVDDTHVTLPQATVDALFADPFKLTKGARVVPAMKSGLPDGFKLYAIRPSSVLARFGFTNGDTVQAINGDDVSNAAKALEVYQKLRTAKIAVVAILRRGRPLALTITVK